MCSVKYLGALPPQNNSGKGFHQIFGGSTAPKYLMDGVPSNIWGLYNPKIIHGWGSFKYLGGLQPQNLTAKAFEGYAAFRFCGLICTFLLVVCFCLITPFPMRVRVLPVRLLCAFEPQLPGSVRAIALRD